MASIPQHEPTTNKAIKYLKKAVSKFKSLKLPLITSTHEIKPQCFAICIDNIGPIQIPTFYTPQNDTNGKIEILLHFSIFDSEQSCFIGRTWKSEAFKTNRNQAIPIQKFWIYLKSIPYESKWIIIELVSQIRCKSVIISQISLGWNVIKLFTNIRALIDVHPDENNNDPLQRESKQKIKYLFRGSPTYLLLNNDINNIQSTSTKLQFKLFTFKKFVNISHLLSTDSIIGGSNIIPSLSNTLSIPHNPYDKKWNIIFNSIQKSEFFILSSPLITLPDNFEINIINKLTNIRKNNYSNTDKGKDNDKEMISSIIDRELNISFYNGRNIINTETIIKLQKDSKYQNILIWDGDIKLKINSNLQNDCWLLISLNYNIEWKYNDIKSAQLPSYYHNICLGRNLINITDNKLILNGSNQTQLVLTQDYQWIDDCSLFNHNNEDIPISFTIKLGSKSKEITEIIQKQPQPQPIRPPSLSSIHHVASFDLKDNNNPLSIKSTHSTNTEYTYNSRNSQNSLQPIVQTPNESSNILKSPQGYVANQQGMVAMNWDDIKKQSLMLIPSNVLQKNINSSSKLNLLQESFAVNTYKKLQGMSHSKAKTLKKSHTIRSLHRGYAGFDVSPYDIMPHKKVIDIEQELKISHKRTFIIQCNGFSVKAKDLLLNPIETIIIELDFMGEKVKSDPITISSTNTINNLRESLMNEEKYELLPFDKPFEFEFHILPNQIRQFIEFLDQKYTIFTIWSSNTMFSIGSCRVCFRDYLLQDINKEDQEKGICETIEIPIVYTKIVNDSQSIIETQSNILLDNNSIINGNLSLQIKHCTVKLSDTPKLQYANWLQDLLTNTYDPHGRLCIGNLKLVNIQSKRITADMLHKNSQITRQLQALPPYTSSSEPYQKMSYLTQTITTKWKIPVEAIHEISSHDNTNEWKIRNSNFETMNDFRDRRKQDVLSSLSKPNKYIIQPSCGKVVFFEIKFTNPWNKKNKFNVCMENNNNSELNIVYNPKEVCYLKQKYNVSHTKIKRHLFENNKNEMVLNALETVYIPFKYQSFVFDNNDNIKPRSINVLIYNTDSRENYHNNQNKSHNKLSVIEFEISIETEKFSIDRIYNIYTLRNSKFIGNLPLPQIQHTDEYLLSVKCSNNNIAFEFDKNKENITFRCNIKDKMDKFYFIIYNDIYCIDINEIWEININSCYNETCHGLLGAIIKHDIHLPQHLQSDNISFYCNSDMHNSIQFSYKNNKKTLLNIQYAPTEIGKNLLRINCIDSTSNNKLLMTWLLMIHIEMPQINNSFVIHIENNDNNEIITRKLPYNNGYNCNRLYELISNNPHIIRIKNPVLEIPSQSNCEFILEILTKNIPNHSKEVLLFVTECGNLEQCLRIEVKKGKVTSL